MEERVAAAVAVAPGQPWVDHQEQGPEKLHVVDE